MKNLMTTLFVAAACGAAFMIAPYAILVAAGLPTGSGTLRAAFILAALASLPLAAKTAKEYR